jgi:hypothetical protein
MASPSQYKPSFPHPSSPVSQCRPPCRVNSLWPSASVGSTPGRGDKKKHHSILLPIHWRSQTICLHYFWRHSTPIYTKCLTKAVCTLCLPFCISHKFPRRSMGSLIFFIFTGHYECHRRLFRFWSGSADMHHRHTGWVSMHKWICWVTVHHRHGWVSISGSADFHRRHSHTGWVSMVDLLISITEKMGECRWWICWSA